MPSPREGRASARPRCPWKSWPPSGRAASPFAAVVACGETCRCPWRNMPSPREGRASLSSVALAKEDARPRCPWEGAPPSGRAPRPWPPPCPWKATYHRHGRAERLLGQGARRKTGHCLVGRRDPSPTWCKGRNMPRPRFPWEDAPPSYCMKNVPAGPCTPNFHLFGIQPLQKSLKVIKKVACVMATLFLLNEALHLLGGGWGWFPHKVKELCAGTWQVRQVHQSCHISFKHSQKICPPA